MTEATKTKKPARKTAAKAPVAEAAARQPAVRRAAPSGLYATFTTGGKQYRVQAGDRVKIEKLQGERKEGDKLSFDQVLMIDNGGTDVTLGKPYLTGSVVSATLTKISRYPTIDVIKYKQKSRYFKKNGHRQPYFEIEIDSVK